MSTVQTTLSAILCLLLLSTTSASVNALSSDLLIILDSDGLGFTAQHTLEAQETPINIKIPGQLNVLTLRYFGPNAKALAQQYPDSNNVIQLSQGVVVLRYEHREDEQISPAPGAQSTLELLPMPIAIGFGNQTLHSQSVTWKLPEDLQLLNFHDPLQTGHWNLQGNMLQFESSDSQLSQQILTYQVLDDDQDGVPDSLDHCRKTPADYSVDERGCTLDHDSDDVADSIDQCLDSITGYPVDENGCTLDFDGDGIPNPLDQCRDSVTGEQVDEFGCGLDSDTDGIVDQVDQCNDTPVDVTVDNSGCPIDTDTDSVPDYRDICLQTGRTNSNQFGCAETGGPVVIDGINFLTGSSNLSLTTRRVLNRVARAISHHPELNFEIGAHTDDQGTRRNNRALSERRARAVRQYLMIRGVPPNQITATGFGEAVPRLPNSSLENRQKNRRIELSVSQ